MEQKISPQLAAFIDAAGFFIAKLQRFTAEVNVEEMQWIPAGVANSLAWIVRHCADLLWIMYGRLSGERVPANVGGGGVAWSAVKDVSFDQAAPEPGPEAEARLAYLDRAWQTLKTYLAGHPECEAMELVFERRQQNVWLLLQHNLGDICYHTGQASTLRKLLAVERRRARARSQWAGKAS